MQPQPELFQGTAASRRTDDGHGQGRRIRQRHVRSGEPARAARRRLSGRRFRRRGRHAARGGHHDADRRAERRFGQFRPDARLPARARDIQPLVAALVHRGGPPSRSRPQSDPYQARHRHAPARIRACRHRTADRHVARDPRSVCPDGLHASGRQRRGTPRRFHALADRAVPRAERPDRSRFSRTAHSASHR